MSNSRLGVARSNGSKIMPKRITIERRFESGLNGSETIRICGKRVGERERQQPKAIFLGISGWTRDKKDFTDREITTSLVERGLDVIAIDNAGICDSTLSARVTPSTYLEFCVDNTISVLKEHAKGLPVIVAGHSMGGGVALEVAKKARKNGVNVVHVLAISPAGFADAEKLVAPGPVAWASKKILNFLDEYIGKRKDRIDVWAILMVKAILSISKKIINSILLFREMVHGINQRIRDTNTEFWENAAKLDPKIVIMQIVAINRAREKEQKDGEGIPITVVQTRHDLLVRPDIGDVMEEMFGKEQVTVQTNELLGHFSILEKPRFVIQHVRQILEKMD